MIATSMLDAALAYRRRGWSVVPMRMADKRPARKWKRYQVAAATESVLRGWFGGRSTYGVAAIFGAASDGLGSRDFDTIESYEQWAGQNPELAQLLPTVVTRRGRHVYFRTMPECVAKLRQVMGKLGTGAIACGDGELRVGVGCYSVLPPSVHPSGHIYDWVIPLADDLPVIDLMEAGFIETPKRQPVRLLPSPARRQFQGPCSRNPMEQARRYLAKLPPAIDGQHGSKPTFRAACVLVLGFDLSPEQAFPLLVEYSERCLPPWREQEIWHKLRDAAVKPGPRGYLLHAPTQQFARKRFRSAAVARSYRHAVQHRVSQRRRAP